MRNAPTNNRELDGILKDYLSWAYELGVKDGNGLPEVRKELKALILLDRSQRDLEAKIDENDYHWHHQKALEKEAKSGAVSGYFLNRKADLKAQLESLNAQEETK